MSRMPRDLANLYGFMAGKKGFAPPAVLHLYPTMTATPNPARRAILWGGLLAGAGDYFFAHFFYA